MTEAVKLLVDALGISKEVSSDEGKAILTALKALGPVVPDVSEGLGRSELMGMLGQAPGVRPGMPPTMAGTARPSPMMIGGPR